MVDHALIVVARGAQLLDVFPGDVLLTFGGLLEQLKARGLGVLELSLAPLFLALEVFNEVHHLLVYPVPMTLPVASQLIQTPAERFEHEEHERAEKRRRELAEQRSDANTPDVRIRSWERLHGLRLPSDPAHPILDLIAVSTRLTLAQVRDEQGARAARGAKRDLG